MTRSLVLLRGVNVGGHNKLPMADLRRSLAAEGYGDVSTYIQSGNVMVTSTGPADPGSLEALILTHFGLRVHVVVRTAEEMTAVVAANPYPESATVHVGFMATAPDPVAVEGLEEDRFLPERLACVGREVYVDLPDGMARTKVPTYLGRQLREPMTFRNWDTVTKLTDLTVGG